MIKLFIYSTTILLCLIPVKTVCFNVPTLETPSLQFTLKSNKKIINTSQRRGSRKSKINKSKVTKKKKKQTKGRKRKETKEKKEKKTSYVPENSERKESPLEKKRKRSKINKKINNSIKRKQLATAKKLILSIPKEERSPEHSKILNKINVFEKIVTDEKKFNASFKKEETKDEELKNQIIQLYNEAKSQFLQDNNAISRDLLIHILFLDKRHYKARALLEEGLNLKPREYAVEDIQLKYWIASDVNYYSSNFKKGIENLTTLLFFESENADIYERLGSNYYNCTLFQKALDSWRIAASLDPSKKALPIIIRKTEILLKEQQKRQNDKLKGKNKKAKKKLPPIKNTRLLGVFFDQSSALSFKEKTKKKNPSIELYLYSKENGSIEVRVEKNNKKGAK